MHLWAEKENANITNRNQSRKSKNPKHTRKNAWQTQTIGYTREGVSIPC